MKIADARPCGASANINFSDVVDFMACMRIHGWRVDGYPPRLENRAQHPERLVSMYTL